MTHAIFMLLIFLVGGRSSRCCFMCSSPYRQWSQNNRISTRALEAWSLPSSWPLDWSFLVLHCQLCSASQVRVFSLLMCYQKLIWTLCLINFSGTIQTGACILTVIGNIVVYFTLFGFFLGETTEAFWVVLLKKCMRISLCTVSLLSFHTCLAFQEDHGWQI